MNLYCIRYSKFTKNNEIKTKHKVNGKVYIFFIELTVVL